MKLTDPRLGNETLLRLAATRALLKRAALEKRHAPPVHWWAELLALAYQHRHDHGPVVLGVMGLEPDTAADLLTLDLESFLALCGVTDIPPALLQPPEPEPDLASPALVAARSDMRIEVRMPAPAFGSRPRRVVWGVR